MGLFSGDSESNSYSTTNYYSDQKSNSTGDLAHDNIQVGGNYSPVGLSGSELSSVLGFGKNTVSDALGFGESVFLEVLDVVQGTYDTSVSSIQKSAEKAIEASADSYTKANSTTATFFDSVTPALAIAAVAVVALLILRSK